MDSTHIRWLREGLEKIQIEEPEGRNGKIRKDKREVLRFQAGGALNFITAASHCGEKTHSTR